MVRMERLELSRLSALVPKTSVYTNFTTSAYNVLQCINNKDKPDIVKILIVVKQPNHVHFNKAPLIMIITGADGETRTLTPFGTGT